MIVRFGFGYAAWSTRIASIAMRVPVPLSVAPDDPSHESKWADSITYSSGRSVPRITPMVLKAGTSPSSSASSSSSSTGCWPALSKALAAGLLILAVPTAAQAQAFVYLGGGATIPTNLYKSEDGAKTGWMAAGGVGFPVGENGASVGVELNYGSNKHEAPPEGDKTNLYGASVWGAYGFGNTEKAHPYVSASVGTLKHDYRSTAFPDEQGGNYEFAWSAGLGVDVPVGSGSTSVYLESRYFARGDTKFIGIFAGLSFGVGGSD